MANTARSANASGAGKKQVPLQLKVLKGQGRRADGIDTDSGGRPIIPAVEFDRVSPVKPDGLSPDASDMWDKITEQTGKYNLLKPLDGFGLRVACETYARWMEAVRRRQQDGIMTRTASGTAAGPWVGVEERAGRDFRAWCAEFGLTPATEKNLGGGGDPSVDVEIPF